MQCHIIQASRTPTGNTDDTHVTGTTHTMPVALDMGNCHANRVVSVASSLGKGNTAGVEAAGPRDRKGSESNINLSVPRGMPLTWLYV